MRCRSSRIHSCGEFSLYHDAVDTRDLHHVNHVDAEGGLPIAFSLYHYVNIHDATFVGTTGQLPIWNDDWQEQVQMTIPAHGKGEPVAEMSNQRIGDYDAFKDYQRAVLDRTEHHLATVDPADLDRVIIAPPYPPQVAGGEIELARGFLSLSGTSA